MKGLENTIPKEAADKAIDIDASGEIHRDEQCVFYEAVEGE